MKSIWIRNDDISACDEKYQLMINIYKKYDISVILCAIPTIIDSNCFNLIDDCDNFEISQHGYSHKNYGKFFLYNYSIELCDKRNIDDVVQEMLEGKQLLEEMSNKKVDILTPPFNRIDKKLELELSNYYSTLSTYGNYVSKFKYDLNPCIDIIDWKTRRFDQMHFERKFNSVLNSEDNIGICIHYNFLSYDDIKYLDEFFCKLEGDDNIVLRRSNK